MLLLVKLFAITVAWTLVDSYKQRDKLFFIHKSSGENNETLLVVTWTENDDEINAGCEFFKDKELINEVLRSSNDAPIRTLSEDEMENLLEDCTEFTLRRRRRDESEDGEGERATILPSDIDDDPSEFANGQRNNGRRRQNNPNRQGNNSNRQGNNANRQGNNTNRQGNDANRQGNNASRQGNNASRQGNNASRQGNNASRQGNNARSGQNNAGNGQTDRQARRISTTSASPNDIEEETTTIIQNEDETTTIIQNEDEITTIIQNADATTPGYDGLPVIFPGTKWCGAGDRAKNYDDLGLHQDTDRCCRAHDYCNDTLAPGETRNNLTNTSPFTKLSCQCDHDFFDCLDRVNTVTSNTIGNMYFNILRRECYQLDYPLTKKCKKYRTILRLKCIEYERNTKAPKENQWVPARKYKKIPFPGPITVTLPF